MNENNIEWTKLVDVNSFEENRWHMRGGVPPTSRQVPFLYVLWFRPGGGGSAQPAGGAEPAGLEDIGQSRGSLFWGQVGSRILGARA